MVLDRLTAPPGLWGGWRAGRNHARRSDAADPPVAGPAAAAPVAPAPDARPRFGRLGDVLQLGPISATAVAQLGAGVLALPCPDLPTRRRVGSFVMARLAGTQDLWQALPYLLKPVIRLVLAVIWLVSGVMGLLLPQQAFPMVHAPLWLARAGGMADLARAAALLRSTCPMAVAQARLALVLAYTLVLTLLAPELWADPFGGLLKNLAVLALIAVHMALAEER